MHTCKCSLLWKCSLNKDFSNQIHCILKNIDLIFLISLNLVPFKSEHVHEHALLMAFNVPNVDVTWSASEGYRKRVSPLNMKFTKSVVGILVSVCQASVHLIFCNISAKLYITIFIKRNESVPTRKDSQLIHCLKPTLIAILLSSMCKIPLEHKYSFRK